MSFADLPSHRRTLSIALVVFALAAAAGAGQAWATVTAMKVSRTTFSPNGDGVHDSVFVSWSLTSPAANVVVEVRAADSLVTSRPLRQFVLGPQPAGPDTIVWNGRDSADVVAPDRLYTLRVTERAPVVDTVLTTGAVSVALDNTAPTVPEFPGLDGLDTTDSTLALEGLVVGADTVHVFVGGVPRDTLVLAPTDSSFSTSIRLELGDNAIAAQAFDRAGNRSGLSVASTVTYRNTTDVLDFRVLPTRISPNGDGVFDTTRVTLRLDVPTTRLEVQIRRAIPPGGTAFADSVPYVRLFDGPAIEGTYGFTWNGLDSLGALAPDGAYFAFVRAESTTALGGPAVGRPRTLRVDVDVTPPAAPTLTEALPVRTTHGSIHLVGFATGADSVRVARGGTRIAEGPGSFDLTISLQRGVNTITLDAVDAAGNVSPPAGPFFVTYDEVPGFHAPERFRAGDVFEVNLANSPSEVRIELFTLEGRLLRTLVSSSSSPSQELAWNLLDQRGRGVGDGPCVARLTVRYPNGEFVQTKAAVVVAK
jgi:flagellar hook assembly protein FlgD